MLLLLSQMREGGHSGPGMTPKAIRREDMEQELKPWNVFLQSPFQRLPRLGGSLRIPVVVLEANTACYLQKGLEWFTSTLFIRFIRLNWMKLVSLAIPHD